MAEALSKALKRWILAATVLGPFLTGIGLMTAPKRGATEKAA